MDVAEEPLESRSAVPEGYGRCVFTGCRDVPLGMLQELAVEGSPAAEMPVAFLDADGEVRFPRIVILGGGSLGTVLQNRWEDGRGGGGHYSMLHYARELEIWNNPQAVRDLAAYVEGTYPLGEHWEWEELGRDMKVTIIQTGTELQFLQVLRGYFTTVVLDRVRAEDMVWTPLDGQNNRIDDDKQHVFTGCRRVPSGELWTLYVYGSPAAEVPVAFHDADNEVRFPEIRIKKGGNLKAVLHNRWEDGAGGGGYYSLLPHVQRLEVWDNSRALRDLLAYVEGEYQLGEHWQRRGPPGGIGIKVWCAEEDLPVVEQLRQHFDRVEVQVTSAALRADNTVNVECDYFAFTDCRDVQPRSLAVDANVANGEIGFHGANDEVHVPELAVGPQGSLGAVVRNRWCNGREGREREDGRYSLLWHAKALTIRGNPQAVRDLAAYVAGRYGMNDPRWPVRPLGRGLRLTVGGAAGCEAEVGALAEYFGVICVDGRRVLGETRRRMLADRNEREEAMRSLCGRIVGETQALNELTAVLEKTAEKVQKARGRLARLRERLAALVAAAR